ncbi:hypothetical protein ACFE04_015297 [Oxalis oulophora]
MSAEQLLKKRKHYDFERDSPLPLSKKPTQIELEPSVPSSPPTQDAIGSVHDCYNRLKACVDMKKTCAHHVPQLEQVWDIEETNKWGPEKIPPPPDHSKL